MNKGTITITFTVWCHDCEAWEYASAETKTKREAWDYFKSIGWEYSRFGGWRCPKHRICP